MDETEPKMTQNKYSKAMNFAHILMGKKMMIMRLLAENICHVEDFAYKAEFLKKLLET